jgi:flagellar L-ring protein FlgH
LKKEWWKLNKNYLLIVSLFILYFGCSTLKTKSDLKKAEVEEVPEPIIKYSTDPNYAPVSDREYRRMTRQKMEDDSALHAGAGSLWVMEGQTSYLFAQNRQRRAGDATQIKVEGAALKQLEMKVSTIQDLLIELETQRKRAELEKKILEYQTKKAEQDKIREEEIQNEKDKLASAAPAGKIPKPEELQKTAEENVNKRMPALEMPTDKSLDADATKKEIKPDLKEVDLIPTRIVEKTAEGLYRVSGQQIMTIMKKPYKVIATGLVRPEDFDDVSVNSSKLLEPQYDVIHIKKAEKF